MTVCIQKRDRCRICFSLILRDRSTLFSSICCQKYYHLFKNVQRTKIPNKKYSPFKIKVSNRTVCFRDLILRYLRTQIEPIKNYSNFICYDCSMVLLDIEQCSKYLRRTINQLKTKYNKSNRLITSSLSAAFQKKNQCRKTIKNEELPIMNSDDDEEEFDDMDNEEEFDDRKVITSTNSQRINLANNNGQCNDDEEGDDDDDDEEDEEDEEKLKQNNLSQFANGNVLSNLNPTDPTINFLREANPNVMQLQLAHMMANAFATGATTPSSASQNIEGTNPDSVMNTWATMHRNFLMKILSDPTAAAQAAISTSQMKANLLPMSLVSPSNKQSGSGRKRKSTPEKRVITNYRSKTNNNGDSSPRIDHESMSNSINNINNQGRTDGPLELTVKSSHPSNRVTSSADVQNLVINQKKENGTPTKFYQHNDEDHKESSTLNDSSASLSSVMRHLASGKRQRVSTSDQIDYTNTHNNASVGNLPQTTTELLSPNHPQTSLNEDNNANINQRQRRLDPRSCSECGKVLFSDKNLLLHCQTHAKNEKQCWICGVHDNEIKKHILTEHGAQKITNNGFKCQYCEKVFPVFADLETHTKDHSKKKPFECPICNKRFGQQGNLSCHLRIHSGVKPFTCANCGKAFRHSNSLRRHARTVHSASRGLSTPTSFLLPNTTTSLSNDMKTEAYDDGPSALMIPSDDSSSSTGGVPSPAMSNTQVDSDSHEQLRTN